MDMRAFRRRKRREGDVLDVAIGRELEVFGVPGLLADDVDALEGDAVDVGALFVA
jgi:hypothetical protein